VNTVKTIGVDVGGTNIRAGFESNGVISQQKQALLENKDSLSATIEQLTTFIRPLVDSSVRGIGIGVPSVVDVDKGIVFNVENIPSWERVHLKEILEETFQIPVFVNNDVNCYVLGEHQFGLAKGFSSVVGLASGTALGSGIIVNNQLYAGNNCGAGEIGLLPYLGHNIEYYASGNFFKAVHQTTAVEMHDKALEGDKHALQLWNEFGKHMGEVIKIVMYTYDPKVIVIGGSLAKAFNLFAEAMYATLHDFSFPESIKRLKVFQSQNPNIALLGAAALVAPH